MFLQDVQYEDYKHFVSVQVYKNLNPYENIFFFQIAYSVISYVGAYFQNSISCPCYSWAVHSVLLQYML